MEYAERIQQSLDYIEENLRQPLELAQIADRAYCSLTHFYRVFRALTGCTVKEYVRRRRLSEAAVDLFTSSISLASLAFDYQFASQEAFARAFAHQHGITPGRCRRDNSQLPLFERVDAIARGQSATHLNREPQFVTCGPFPVVGVENARRLPPSGTSENSAAADRFALWRESFAPRLEALSPRLDGTPIIFERRCEDERTFLTGLALARPVAPPPDMVIRTVPAGRYAIFSLENHRADGDPLAYAHIVWLPHSGYEVAGDSRFEMYRTSPSGERHLECYIPVQRIGRGRPHPVTTTPLPSAEKRSATVADLDLRIATLEPMRVARFHAFSATPEMDACAKFTAWAAPLGLLDDIKTHRIFGHNNPNPTPGKEKYGYDFFIAIGSDVETAEGGRIEEFPGGLYAVAISRGIQNIGRDWENLVEWVEQSRYTMADHQCLEEHLVVPGSVPEEEMVIDLFLPIAE